MDAAVAEQIARKILEATAKLDEAVEYMHRNVEFRERAPLCRAIGDIFMIVSTEIDARLALANPDLHELLFRGLPANAAADLLRWSDYPNTWSAKTGEEPDASR
jgi:hypothetical protein